MPSRRIQRLNEQLKREIAQIIRTGVQDPRVGSVTVTGVKAAPDLMTAKVFVRPLAVSAAAVAEDPGREKEARKEESETLVGLKAAAPFIRRELGQRLHVRRIPELHFEVDRTLEQAMRIEEILDEVRPEDGWEEAEEEDGPS